MDPVDASKYSWVESKILGTHSALNSLVVVREANIEVGSPSNWSILPTKSGKRICGNFKDCSIPFYKCLFTQINIWLPLYAFQVDVRRFLKVFPLVVSSWGLCLYKGVPVIVQVSDLEAHLLAILSSLRRDTYLSE